MWPSKLRSVLCKPQRSQFVWFQFRRSEFYTSNPRRHRFEFLCLFKYRFSGIGWFFLYLCQVVAGKNLSNANLSDTTLGNVSWDEMNLVDVNLSNVVLSQGQNFRGTTLKYCRLYLRYQESLVDLSPALFLSELLCRMPNSMESAWGIPIFKVRTWQEQVLLAQS